LAVLDPAGQWNILADCYLSSNRKDAEYAHVDPAARAWPARCRALLAELVAAAADVICLQEVMFTHFDDDLLPALAAAGYTGLMQNDKKRSETHPQGTLAHLRAHCLHSLLPDCSASRLVVDSVVCLGVATFWRTAGYQLVGECHRSRTVTVVLQDSAGRRLAVVNGHLEGDPAASAIRVKQLQATLAQLRRQHGHQGLLIAGDFNTQLQSSACSAWLALGFVPDGVVDMGRPAQPAAQQLPTHGYGDLASAYQPAAAGDHGDESASFTFCGQPGWPVQGLDQVGGCGR
jgi:mRNA deadenylase 3'-5' endonuclease subunit Ccr4